MKTFLQERSAGGVVYREINDLSNYEFLIGKHSGYHKWVLPKGLVEMGETEQEAAIREVEEEVGVKAEIIGKDPIEIVEYDYFADLDSTNATTRRVKNYQEEGGSATKVHKKVCFYLMECMSDMDKPGWEMEERAWVKYEEAIKRLAFESERNVLGSAWTQLSER